MKVAMICGKQSTEYGFRELTQGLLSEFGPQAVEQRYGDCIAHISLNVTGYSSLFC